MAVKLGRMSPSLAVDVKEESNYERPDAAEETVADDSENDETSDAETGDRAEQKPLSHQQAMEHFKDALAEIVVGDPLLCDLHTEVTLEEIKSQIALEHGKAITVNVRRADDIVLPVVVRQNGTVLELKKAIQRHVILRQARIAGIRRISWRYVWRAYWLYFNGQKLSDDKKLMKEYGISNRDEVTFVKRLHPK